MSRRGEVGVSGSGFPLNKATMRAAGVRGAGYTKHSDDKQQLQASQLASSSSMPTLPSIDNKSSHNGQWGLADFLHPGGGNRGPALSLPAATASASSTVGAPSNATSTKSWTVQHAVPYLPARTPLPKVAGAAAAEPDHARVISYAGGLGFGHQHPHHYAYLMRVRPPTVPEAEADYNDSLAQTDIDPLASGLGFGRGHAHYHEYLHSRRTINFINSELSVTRLKPYSR